MMMTTQENLQPGESELFDVFLSYARADKEVICRLKAALRHAGLSVWMDERIEEFEGVSDTILKGISRSKIFLAWYSKTYITRPACQWELISALTADLTGSDGAFERILVVNPHRDFEHIEPITLRDKHTELAAHANSDTFSQLAERIRLHAARFHDSMGPLPLFQACTAWPARSLASTRTFVGYVPELLRVHGSLWANNHPIASNQYLPGTVQLVGLPGSGKSLLAEEYAARFAGCYPGGIYWLQLSEMLESEAGPHPEDSLEQRRSELLHSDPKPEN